jgi:hypothetical protein
LIVEYTTMPRIYYLIGWSYVAVCAMLVLSSEPAPDLVRAAAAVEAPDAGPHPSMGTPGVGSPATDAAEWFRRVKPYCNAVEVAVLQRQAPAPATLQGVGYHAACFALAGKTDDARKLIDQLPADSRPHAASIVFDIGHPVADAGDDRSAGPIMELVVDYMPQHYMALYHAGMAEYMLGQRELATKNLEAFLGLYHENDGWRTNSLEVLGRLRDSTAARSDARRPREP